MPCNGDCQQGRTCNCECKEALANQISDAITLSATAGQFKNRGTKMKHKWYKEIQAWSEGAEIEIYMHDKWTDIDTPQWHQDNEYRIKPQPKQPKYLYAIQYPNGEIALVEEDKKFIHTLIGKIEVQDD